MQAIHDDWMTEKEFTDLTGIYKKMPMRGLKAKFGDLDALFPTRPFANMHDDNLINLAFTAHILRDSDAYVFVKKLFTVKHLLVDRDMIALQRSIEKYIVFNQRRKYTETRCGNSYTDVVEYHTSNATLRYHNMSVAYNRICQNEMDNASKIVDRLLRKLSRNCADGLMMQYNEQVRLDNIWQSRKGLAVVEASVKQWWPKYKAECKERTVHITFCELVIVNRRLVKGVCRFL